jgi:hypothetical protein
MARSWKYQPAFRADTQVRLKSGGLKRVDELGLGDELTTGVVHGLGKRLVQEAVTTQYGTTVTPSTLVWSENHWIRAGHQSVDTVFLDKEEVFYTILVVGSASIETSTGEVFRDMLEVHSPDMETPTFTAMGVRNEEPEED